MDDISCAPLTLSWVAHHTPVLRHDLPNAVEWSYMVTGFLLGVCALIWVYRACRPQRISGPATISGKPAEEDFRTLVGWEQARVMGCAKGVATSSAGFLLATATALVKDEIRAPSLLAVLGCVSGAIGLLLFAVVLSRDAMAFAFSAFGYSSEPK